MKKKLYYVVEHEYQDAGETKEQNGLKSVTMYSIDNNIPTKMGILDLRNEDNSKESIQDWLNDNGYEDENIELVQL